MSKGKTVFLVFVCLAIVTGIIFLVVFLTKPPEATADQINLVNNLGLADSPSQWCMMPQIGPRDGDLGDVGPDYSPFNPTPPSPGTPAPGKGIYPHADLNKNSFYTCQKGIPMYNCVLQGYRSFENENDCKQAGKEYNYCNQAGRILETTTTTKKDTDPLTKPANMSQYDFCTKPITPKWKEQQKKLPAHQQMSVLNK
jgi:hypothetical protein